MRLAGVDLATLLIVAAFACSLGMPLPVSTPPNAMAFGFSHGPGGKGSLVARDMIVPGTLLGVLGLAVLLTVATLWFPVILGAPPLPQIAPTSDATRAE